MVGLGDGQVAIDLGGDINYLKPTLKAAFELSRKYQGFSNLERAMLARDLDAFVDVLMASADRSPESRGEIERVVYEEGIATGGAGVNEKFFKSIDEFVAVLQNGGRPLGKVEGEGEDADSGEAAGV